MLQKHLFSNVLLIIDSYDWFIRGGFMNRNQKIIKIILLVLILLSILLILYKPQISLSSGNNNLNVQIFKVGKADAIVVENNNEYMVIDVGEEDDGYEIVNYLQDRGVFKIKKLVITHFDKDHVGGADTLVENIDVEEIIIPNYKGTVTDYREFIDALEKANIKPIYLTETMIFNLGDSKVIVEPPLNYNIEPENENAEVDNDLSLITTIQHYDNRLVFLGDAEKLRLKEWLATPSAIKCDFIKFPHHGVYSTEHENMLNKLEPSYAAICSSSKNPADTKTIQLLKNRGVKVAETKNGDISIVSDGKKVYMYQKGE